MDDSRFETLVTHAPVCIHEIDLDGRLTAMNPAGLAMMGVDDEAAIRGMPYLDAVSETDRARIAELLQHAMREGDAHFEFESSGDTPRVFASNFIPVRGPDGELVNLMGVTQDVTERRRAEAALRELNQDLERQVAERTADLRAVNQELAARNKELDAFARAVSHDLKSPLASITGLASLLETARLGVQELEDVRKIRESGVRMGRMIDELLALAQVGSVTAHVDEAVDLASVVDAVCEDLAPQLSELGARVTHDGLPTVRGAASEQRRLLQNLIENAVKYRGEQPLRVRVSAEVRADDVLVTVADNGRGIAEDQHDQIFVLFGRGPAGLDQPGSGVGLATCKKLVEARGGTLDVVSRPGEGAAFTYTLPT